MANGINYEFRDMGTLMGVIKVLGRTGRAVSMGDFLQDAEEPADMGKIAGLV